MYKRVIFGKIVHDNISKLTDISSREFLVLFILAAATLFMGLYPKYFTDFILPSVDKLVEHLAQSKL